ncbi:MAG: PLDc N-terminal domain-containing protein [Actinomycetota bacterium]
MFYGVTFLLSMALLVFCVLDCIATDSSLVRTLPKTMWILLIIFLPIAGSVGWLLLGRPEKTPFYPGDARTLPVPQARPKRPLGPDDDPRFLEMTRNIGTPKMNAPPKTAEPAKGSEPPAPSPDVAKAGTPSGEHGVNELKSWEEDLRRREEELRRRLEGESPSGD